MNLTAEVSFQCRKHRNCVGLHRTVRQGVSAEALAHLNRISHHRSYPRGSIIQAQGEIGSMVGNIVEGVVKLTRASVNGNEHIVGLVFPSAFFGRLFAEEMRFSYEAATDVTLCLMNKSAFERFLIQNPAVEHEMLKAKLDELDAVREWAAITNGQSTMQRVASLLYIFSKRPVYQHPDEATWASRAVQVPLSRSDIADYLGMTPETLSRNLQILARSKVIRIIDAKEFELLNVNELIKHSGELRADLDKIASM